MFKAKHFPHEMPAFPLQPNFFLTWNKTKQNNSSNKHTTARQHVTPWEHQAWRGGVRSFLSPRVAADRADAEVTRQGRSGQCPSSDWLATRCFFIYIGFKTKDRLTIIQVVQIMCSWIFHYLSMVTSSVTIRKHKPRDFILITLQSIVQLILSYNLSCPTTPT